MNTEEELVKQLEGIVSSMIKALESLEKEFSEYIDVTNKRLQVLEDRIQRFDSLAAVSGQGLVKAIEGTPDFEKVEGLAHLSTQKTETQPPQTTPPVTAEIESKEEIQPQDIQPTIEIPSPSDVIEETPTTPQTDDYSELPPVPVPPTFKTDDVIETPEPEIEGQLASPVVQQPIAPTGDSIPKTEVMGIEDEDDKKELMSALKLIDSL